QLRAVADDPAPLLRGAGQEAGDVHERQEGDVEGVAGAYEASPLLGGVDVEHAGERGGLVADDPDRVTVEAGEATDDVRSEMLMDLQQLAVVDHEADHVAHVVRLVR